MKRRTGLYLTGALIAVLVASAVSFAAVPQTISYQGFLAHSGGMPVNGTVQMQFSLYSSPTATVPLWSESHLNVQVNQGSYSVILGNGSPTPKPIDLSFDVPYYLGVTVGSDAEMTPRLPLTSTGYSMRAAAADSIVSSGSVTITGGTNGNVVIAPGGSGTIDVSNTRITNAASPTASTDVATKLYVDSEVAGLITSVTNLGARVTALEGTPPPTSNLTVVVALDGTGNFTSPIAAVNSITDASPTKRYTVRIRPGVYDLGTSVLQMKSFVIVEGSGQQNTTIKGTKEGSGLVTAESVYDSEIRSLTVVNGSVDYAIVIYVSDSSVIVRDVTATDSGTTLQTIVIKCQNSSLTMTNVHAEYVNPGAGIVNNTCSVVMTDILTSSMTNFKSDITMTRVSSTSQAYSAISNEQSNVVMNDVTAIATGNNDYHVVGVFNFNCPSVSMTNVTASAWASPSSSSSYQSAYGVLNQTTTSTSTVSMTNVSATGRGARDFNYGIENNGIGITVNMSDVTAIAFGGGMDAMGVVNVITPVVTMNRVTASASGASRSNVGIRGVGTTVNINNSTISATGGLYNYSLYTFDSIFKVTNTKLQGNAYSQSWFLCTDVTDFSGNPLDGNCQ